MYVGVVCMLYVMYVRVGNSQESVIPYEFPMGKLVSVVKHVDVRKHIACAYYVMYVRVGNPKEGVIPYGLPMGKLVGVVKRVDVRGCKVCTL